MKNLALLVVCVVFVGGLNAQAAVSPSREGIDYGVVTGALYSKVRTVTAAGFTYTLIDSDMEEPAANSHQLVINVSGESLDLPVVFNLGRNFNFVKSVVKSGSGVIVTLSSNNIAADYGRNGYPQIEEKILIQYRSDKGDLSTRIVR